MKYLIWIVIALLLATCASAQIVTPGGGGSAGGVTGGACISPQFVQAIDASGNATCATPAGGGGAVSITAGNSGITVSPSPLTGTGTIALAANPAGGQLNYAPIASPIHTGTTTTPVLNITSVGGAAAVYFGTVATPQASIWAGTSAISMAGGAHYNGTNYIADATTASLFLGGTNMAFYSNAGLTVGATFTPTQIGYFGPAGLNIITGNLQFNSVALGGTCTAGQYVSALSGTGVLTCGTPAGGGGLPTATAPYLTLQSSATNAAVWNKHIGVDAAPKADDANGSYPYFATASLNNGYQMILNNTSNGNNAATEVTLWNDHAGTDWMSYGYTSTTLSGWGPLWFPDMGFMEATGTGGMLLFADNGVININTKTAGKQVTVLVGGTQVAQWNLGQTIGTPTGGDKGAGTLNATGLYINGAAVALASLAGTTSSVGFNFAGTPPASSIAAFTCGFGLTIPTNFTTPTSQATCGTNPSEADAYTVKVNGVSVGTITLSTTCVATLGTATATTCAAGQRMEIDAPAVVSGKDIAITIAATR